MCDIKHIRIKWNPTRYSNGNSAIDLTHRYRITVIISISENRTVGGLMHLNGERSKWQTRVFDCMQTSPDGGCSSTGAHSAAWLPHDPFSWSKKYIRYCPAKGYWKSWEKVQTHTLRVMASASPLHHQACKHDCSIHVRLFIFHQSLGSLDLFSIVLI